MRRQRILQATFLVLVGWALLGDADARDGAVVRFETTRSYVKGYKVRDGFVLPVFGRVRSGARLRLGARCDSSPYRYSSSYRYGNSYRHGSSYRYRNSYRHDSSYRYRSLYRSPRRRPRRSYSRSRRRSYTRKSEDVVEATVQPVKKVVSRPPKEGPRMVTVIGRLHRHDDGLLRLTVEKKKVAITYTLKTPAAAETLLLQQGKKELRVVVVGHVDAQAEPGVFYVNSVWVVESYTKPSR